MSSKTKKTNDFNRLSVAENLEQINREVNLQPKWRVQNTLLAFSEYSRKKKVKDV